MYKTTMSARDRWLEQGRNYYKIRWILYLMNVNMPILRIVYCLMEVHFLSLGSKRRPWEICPCDGTRFCNRSLRQELYQFQRFHHEYPIPLEASWSLLSYATTHTFIEAVCRELCLFWWRLFQSHVVQTGPIWLLNSRWILYHSIRFYPCIIHGWKAYQVYFHMQQTAHRLKLYGGSYTHFCEDCSETM